MRVRVGCEFQYESDSQTPGVMLVQPHLDDAPRIIHEVFETRPTQARWEYRDHFGNRCQRLVLPPGPATVRYDAVMEISGLADAVDQSATQAPVDQLPDTVLVYTLPSRYCLSDVLADTAWGLFGGTEPGWMRVQAVCDWINANITYGVMSTPQTTAVDTYERHAGVCRDFAHLAVTFCRALVIPARYVFGYLPDIDVPPPYPPMDFHAWFEVYLGGQWWTFDARFNRPRIGRVPIGRGRDAVDVAMMTTYGAARLQQMTVWSDVVDDGWPASGDAVVGANEAALEIG